jgi:hypothetical protein
MLKQLAAEQTPYLDPRYRWGPNITRPPRKERVHSRAPTNQNRRRRAQLKNMKGGVVDL